MATFIDLTQDSEDDSKMQNMVGNRPDPVVTGSRLTLSLTYLLFYVIDV